MDDRRKQAVKGWPMDVSTEFDGFSVLRWIGEGSLSTVFLAWEPAHKRFVALKVLKSDFANDESARVRFRSQAQVGANISHPNVSTYYRAGQRADGLPYVALEYIGGESLADLLASAEVGATDELTRIVAGLARGLAAAHAEGIVHGAVDPRNILIERDTGRVVLTNFKNENSPERSTASDVLNLGSIGIQLLGNNGPESSLRVLKSCMDPNPDARPTADQVVRMLPNVERTTVLHDPRIAERAINSSLMRVAVVSGLVIMALGASVALWLFIHYSG